MKQIALGVILVLTIGLMSTSAVSRNARINERASNSGSKNSSSSSDSKKDNNAPETTYTTAQVATHNAADDCWTIIDDKVYDITAYIPRHTGGDRILLACGVDGSRLFEQRRTEDGERIGTGRPHSSYAEDQLAPLQIGRLTDKP